MSGATAPPHRLRRVLALLPSMGLGGAEAMTAVLLRALHEDGVALDIAVEPALRDGFAAMLGGAGEAVSAAPVGWREAEGAARNIRRQAAIVGARLLADPPDLVLLPLPWPSHGLGVLQALLPTAIPALAIAHLAPREPDPALVKAVAAVAPEVTLRPATRWVAVAGPTAARLEAALGLPAGRCTVLPNGVKLPRIPPRARLAARQAKRDALGLAEDAILLVAAGRLEPKKGADLLPGLARTLDRRLPGGATVAALGEGPARALLEAEPAASGAGAKLRLPGRVGDVGEWMLAADALLLPSRLEGCPLVFLEAAARRCPVVATEAALEGFGEAAFDMAAVAADHSVATLADQAVALLTGPETARRLRLDAAERQAAAWDEAAMLRQYRLLLRAALPPTALAA